VRGADHKQSGVDTALPATAAGTGQFRVIIGQIERAVLRKLFWRRASGRQDKTCCQGVLMPGSDWLRPFVDILLIATACIRQDRRSRLTQFCSPFPVEDQSDPSTSFLLKLCPYFRITSLPDYDG
jgi:hypothetical protein